MLTTIKDVDDFFQSRSNLGIKPGLSRVETMLTYCNHPEHKLKAVHLAGTNGKGSTLTFIKQALMESGYKVGSFTSPSLNKINEQIQINHQPIEDEKFVQLLNKLLPIISHLDEKDNPPTEFEITVIIAILYFVNQVDVALIETGMGGREDSTNLIQPILTIITNIGLDHGRFLGETYTEVAYHKAGIIKNKVPVIIGDVNQQSLAVIQKVAGENCAEQLTYSEDFSIENVQRLKDQQSFNLISNDVKLSIAIMMKGKHQCINAAVACMALLKIKEIGFVMELSSIQKGLLKAHIPGRFEKICENPIVFVDGAHNKEGIETFIETVSTYYQNNEKQLLFAAFKDKPLQEMINQVELIFDQVVFTSFDHERASNAHYLASLSNHKQKKVEENWIKAIQDNIIGYPDKIHFITGSLSFIGKVRNYFVN
ncbi:bifunctional folylpolyglutamate synthase/dihydrofolate synthase [Aquibacillus rhizosphaerae]|uniref:tetrahydrofolate synthase n=1 Tax=Aquibacillus rhizosphaerae TaxID=3051431 RepID=A0ABT7L759_9BACI|nr:folylpolyglutamate synthase/dihydrofolate synthase family protein [Aquibacillus sp. LR5S19]MDL4841683.1 folylpolyglutamate synthase/dihydrofolate synthase family protein [Aquibacillus sp. LR5S19]